MDDFYLHVVNGLLDRRLVERGDRVLVVCGGSLDREVMLKAGFENVVISNLDVRMHGAEEAYAPYGWSFQDAEALEFEDGAFDLVIAHSGLHHCRSPHRGLLEMYRVARKAVLVFEPRDGWLVRLGVRWGLGQDYELAAVVGNECRFGGVANTAVPNYVFRWNRGDVEKTIHSFAPHARHRFEYSHALRVPWGRLEGLKNPFWLRLIRLLRPVLLRAGNVVPALANNLAFLVLKPRLPEALHPWLCLDAGGQLTVNRPWLRTVYADQHFADPEPGKGHPSGAARS